MKSLKYELDSGLHIEYDTIAYSKELDRLCDVRLSTKDMVVSVFDDYIPNTVVANRIYIDKDLDATASVYDVNGNYVRMALAGNMDSPLFVAALIHELSHAKQALNGFWKGLLYDYNDVRNGQYMLGPNKLVAIGQVLPEVENVFNANVKMRAYFDEYHSIVAEFDKLSYPYRPSPCLWSRLTGAYGQKVADYEAHKMEVDCRRGELQKRRSNLKPNYNQVMCDRLPSLLVEFDANQRTFEYLKDLRSRGFALPESCIAPETGEYVGLEKRLEYAVGYWVVGEFAYPTDLAGVAKLCN